MFASSSTRSSAQPSWPTERPSRLRELPPEVSQKKKGRATWVTPLNLRSQERELIRRALERYKGNRKRAAEALNISTVTLWRKMKEYDLTA